MRVKEEKCVLMKLFFTAGNLFVLGLMIGIGIGILISDENEE